MKALDIANYSKNGDPLEKNNCKELIVCFFSTGNPNSGERNITKLQNIIDKRLAEIDLSMHFIGYRNSLL
jgi:hypothetical protein